jgi:hypothetical protein
MESTTMTMTAFEPAIGMPGHQSAPRAASCVRATGASWIARGRHAVLPVLATDAAAKGAFPGPDAWSPPTD